MKKKQIFFILMIALIFFSCKKIKQKFHKNPKPDNYVFSPIIPADSDDYPLCVWSNSLQPNPNQIPPVIFYSPHQDDETLGMGASISEHVRKGRPVYVVLLTNGENVNLLKHIQNKYKSEATMKDLVTARNNEFIAACIALGVSNIFISNLGNGFSEKTGVEYLQEKFIRTMEYFNKYYPNASHKTVSGNCDSYDNNCHKMSTHQVATNSLHYLYNQGLISDIRLYRVYIYYNINGQCGRKSNWIKEIDEIDKTNRKAAIEEYKLIDPLNQRYGLGYKSVDLLFDNSVNSNFEYIDYISNDY